MATSETTNRDDFNQQVIDQFRANGGTMVSGMFKGAPLLLLTTTGARSGRRRTTPLAHTRDGDRYVVIASKGGAPSNPDWFRNVVANPEVTVEVGGETFEARASIPTGNERKRLFDQQAAIMPNFAEYQRNTSREIPVVVLERAPTK
ncbi:MAG: nitroreductase family deazaflavin-dependent oxidoreductase [Chloroflexi bacterium]|nr:nitroreductase family deazaflavin-dependent oxidoreductase [Chloroflexota bacterium]